MAAKIAVFTLLVIICKVQSQVQYPYTQSCSVPTSNNNAQNQGSCNTQLNQPQTIQIQPSNSNNGIKASPQLKIVPGQRCNLQAIPLSQYTGSNFQRSQPQNCGCDNPRQNIQVNPISQVPSSVSQLQPSLCGPSSVITSPVSSISIPPTSCTTIIDNSLSNSLANALQMMIANEFMNAYSNNINAQDCFQIPEAVVPGFDLAGLLQSLNAKQCGQVTNKIVTVPSQDSTTSQYPTSSQCQTPSQYETPSQYTTPNSDYNSPVTTNDWSNLLQRLQDNCQSEKPQTEWDKVRSFLDKQNQQAVKPSQNQQGNCQTQGNSANNDILEAIAAYLGCETSEVCSSSLPTISEIYFPEEIPAQLVCSYGYMPTTVPVISFGVQPVNCGGDSGSNFIIGC